MAERWIPVPSVGAWGCLHVWLHVIGSDGKGERVKRRH
jgi:hypothetical protein